MGKELFRIILVIVACYVVRHLAAFRYIGDNWEWPGTLKRASSRYEQKLRLDTSILVLIAILVLSIVFGGSWLEDIAHVTLFAILSTALLIEDWMAYQGEHPGHHI